MLSIFELADGHEEGSQEGHEPDGRQNRQKRETKKPYRETELGVNNVPRPASMNGVDTPKLCLVDYLFAVPECYKPIPHLKWSLQNVFTVAEWHLGLTLKLGKLNMQGPYITPMELGESWTEARKYIKIHGDDSELFRRQGSYRVDLDLTLCVASDCELSEMDISTIDRVLEWKGIHFVHLRPASMNEVEAILNE